MPNRGAQIRNFERQGKFTNNLTKKTRSRGKVLDTRTALTYTFFYKQSKI